MKPPVYLDVDPRTLRLPWSRRAGADPGKLARQISRHGNSTQGVPPLFVYRATDGELVLSDGVTRATRVAKLLPGTPIRVGVIGALGALGDRIRLVAEPPEWQRPGYHLPSCTRRLWLLLIARRRSLRVCEVDEWGAPWLCCRFRKRDGGWEHHYLA